jgi:hypothetical protein
MILDLLVCLQTDLAPKNKKIVLTAKMHRESKNQYPEKRSHCRVQFSVLSRALCVSAVKNENP